MSVSNKKQIYDDIVLDYAAAKTNVFKAKYEETEVWKEIGDVTGQVVLDLACGSGYYSRQFKQKGAKCVVGVDISEEMIKEGRNIEKETPLGISYQVEDALKYVGDRGFDTVTALYLFCYAESRETLLDICHNVYNNTSPGGRFISLTTVLDQKSKLVDMSLGYKFVACPVGEDQTSFDDVLKVDCELYSEDMRSKCCFPNFLWKPETIAELLYSAGFSSVNIRPILSGVPVMIICATRNK